MDPSLKKTRDELLQKVLKEYFLGSLSQAEDHQSILHPPTNQWELSEEKTRTSAGGEERRFKATLKGREMKDREEKNREEKNREEKNREEKNREEKNREEKEKPKLSKLSVGKIMKDSGRLSARDKKKLKTGGSFDHGSRERKKRISSVREVARTRSPLDVEKKRVEKEREDKEDDIRRVKSIGVSVIQKKKDRHVISEGEEREEGDEESEELKKQIDGGDRGRDEEQSEKKEKSEENEEEKEKESGKEGGETTPRTGEEDSGGGREREKEEEEENQETEEGTKKEKDSETEIEIEKKLLSRVTRSKSRRHSAFGIMGDGYLTKCPTFANSSYIVKPNEKAEVSVVVGEPKLEKTGRRGSVPVQVQLNDSAPRSSPSSLPRERSPRKLRNKRHKEGKDGEDSKRNIKKKGERKRSRSGGEDNPMRPFMSGLYLGAPGGEMTSSVTAGYLGEDETVLARSVVALEKDDSDESSDDEDWGPKKGKKKENVAVDDDVGDISEDVRNEKWNRTFQESVHCVRQNLHTKALNVRAADNSRLLQLSQDFVHAAAIYGRIIIAEVNFPVKYKTIKPTSIGGLAGGLKYIAHGILFKFAVDEHNLFKGSHHAARKVANEELQGLLALYNAKIFGVSLPLIALVDYRGYRVIATCLLPVSPDTLIYGSSDGGRTAYAKNKQFNRLAREIGDVLSLRQHKVGVKKRAKLMFGGDVEGHLGRDGQFYMLDFSRVLPPTLPYRRAQYLSSPTPAPKAPKSPILSLSPLTKASGSSPFAPRSPLLSAQERKADLHFNSNLYMLFRREFLKKYRAPLCSDGYSMFISTDPQREQYNEELDKATEQLFDRVIPAFAKEIFLVLLEAAEEGIAHKIQVTEYMHRRGINMRYLGKVAKALLKVSHSQHSRSAARLVVLEAAARAVKNLLFEKLRDITKEYSLPVEFPFREMVLDHLNLCFFGGTVTQDYWLQSIGPYLVDHFSFEFGYKFHLSFLTSETEASDTFADGVEIMQLIFNIPESLDAGGVVLRWPCGSQLLLERVSELAGVLLSPHAYQKFSVEPPREPLEQSDLIEIRERVKHMNLVDNSRALYFRYLALVSKSNQDKLRYYNSATISFRKALSSSPNDEDVLFNYALSQQEKMMVEASEDCRKRNCTKCTEEEPQCSIDIMVDSIDPRLTAIDRLFLRAIDAGNKEGIVYLAYAKFLHLSKRRERAEDFFMRALRCETSPVFVFEYASFLACHSSLRESGKKFFQVLTYLPKTAVLLDPLTGKAILKTITVFIELNRSISIQVPPLSTTTEILKMMINYLTGPNSSYTAYQGKLLALSQMNNDQIQGIRYLSEEERPWFLLQTLEEDRVISFVPSLSNPASGDTKNNEPIVFARSPPSFASTTSSFRAVLHRSLAHPFSSLSLSTANVPTGEVGSPSLSSVRTTKTESSLSPLPSLSSLLACLGQFDKGDFDIQLPSQLRLSLSKPLSKLIENLEKVQRGEEKMAKALKLPLTGGIFSSLQWLMTILFFCAPPALHLFASISRVCTCETMAAAPKIEYIWSEIYGVFSQPGDNSAYHFATCLSQTVQVIFDEFLSSVEGAGERGDEKEEGRGRGTGTVSHSHHHHHLGGFEMRKFFGGSKVRLIGKESLKPREKGEEKGEENGEEKGEAEPLHLRESRNRRAETVIKKITEQVKETEQKTEGLADEREEEGEEEEFISLRESFDRNRREEMAVKKITEHVKETKLKTEGLVDQSEEERGEEEKKRGEEKGEEEKIAQGGERGGEVGNEETKGEGEKGEEKKSEEEIGEEEEEEELDILQVILTDSGRRKKIGCEMEEKKEVKGEEEKDELNILEVILTDKKKRSKTVDQAEYEKEKEKSGMRLWGIKGPSSHSSSRSPRGVATPTTPIMATPARAITPPPPSSLLKSPPSSLPKSLPPQTNLESHSPTNLTTTTSNRKRKFFHKRVGSSDSNWKGSDMKRENLRDGSFLFQPQRMAHIKEAGVTVCKRFLRLFSHIFFLHKPAIELLSLTPTFLFLSRVFFNVCLFCKVVKPPFLNWNPDFLRFITDAEDEIPVDFKIASFFN